MTAAEQRTLINAFSAIAAENDLQIHLCCESESLVRPNVDADGCLYCYANYDRETVRRNMTLHDKKSPFLIGNLQEGDVIKDAKQISWKDRQMSIFDLL